MQRLGLGMKQANERRKKKSERYRFGTRQKVHCIYRSLGLIRLLIHVLSIASMWLFLERKMMFKSPSLKRTAQWCSWVYLWVWLNRASPLETLWKRNWTLWWKNDWILIHTPSKVGCMWIKTSETPNLEWEANKKKQQHLKHTDYSNSKHASKWVSDRSIAPSSSIIDDSECHLRILECTVNWLRHFTARNMLHQQQFQIDCENSCSCHSTVSRYWTFWNNVCTIYFKTRKLYS